MSGHGNLLRILFRITILNYEYKHPHTSLQAHTSIKTYGRRWNHWRERFIQHALSAGRAERPFQASEFLSQSSETTSELDAYDDGYYGEYGRFGDATSPSETQWSDTKSERDWENWEHEFGGRDAVLGFDFGALVGLGQAGRDGSPRSGHGRDRSLTINAQDLNSKGDGHSRVGGGSRSRTKSFTSPMRVFSGIGVPAVMNNRIGSDAGSAGVKRTRSSTITAPFFSGR